MSYIPRLISGLAETEGRNSTLDCLRGSAALLVVVHHLHLPIMAGLPIDLGKFGICMFFIISGYIIPNSFNDRDGRLPGAAGFAAKRFFRLYPAYWASMALALCSPLFWSAPPGLPMIAANLTMLQMILGQPNLLLVYWTLQFEIVFYALCAALFLAGQLGKRRTASLGLHLFLTAAMALAIARTALERGFPVALPLSLACMFLGNCLRHAETEGKPGRAAWLLGYFLIAVTAITAIAYRNPLGDPDAIAWYAYAASYALAASTFTWFMFCRPLNSRLFFMLGAISYSVYLVHIVVIAWTDSLFPALAGNSALRMVVVVVTTIAVSVLFYELIEHPAIRLGRRLARALQARLV